MPDAPLVITPDYTPLSPAAPGAATGSYSAGTPTAPGAASANFSAGTPTAPGAASANFSAGTPTAPGAVTPGYQAPVAGYQVSGTISPAVNLFIAEAEPFHLNSLGYLVGNDPPEGLWSAAIREGGIWSYYVFNGLETSQGWTADGAGGEATPDLVLSWSPQGVEEGEPVFTPARGQVWPPLISTAPDLQPEAPLAISAAFSPGSPTAPGAVSETWSDPVSGPPSEVSADASGGTPQAPAAASASFIPSTPAAPPAITT
jgi:hypothetical protein